MSFSAFLTVMTTRLIFILFMIWIFSTDSHTDKTEFYEFQSHKTKRLCVLKEITSTDWDFKKVPIVLNYGIDER